jgi:hypothetical protein
MDKSFVLETNNYILNKIVRFYEFYKNENLLETKFSDWNVRDVIGHINVWIKFSEDKLESIKLKKSFEDVNHVDIEKFNEINYKKYKNESLENVVNESKILLERYKNILNQFSEKELWSKDFPIGFSFYLWKYMIMDLGIYPLMHILFHHLKKRNYNEFIDEIENSKKYFVEYSGNNMKEYYFGDLFENKEELKKRFNELKEVNKNNEMIDEIIKINIGE